MSFGLPSLKSHIILSFLSECTDTVSETTMLKTCIERGTFLKKCFRGIAACSHYGSHLRVLCLGHSGLSTAKQVCSRHLSCDPAGSGWCHCLSSEHESRSLPGTVVCDYCDCFLDSVSRSVYLSLPVSGKTIAGQWPCLQAISWALTEGSLNDLQFSWIESGTPMNNLDKSVYS